MDWLQAQDCINIMEIRWLRNQVQIASSLSLPAILSSLHLHQHNRRHRELIINFNTVGGQSPIKVHKKELFPPHQLASTTSSSFGSKKENLYLAAGCHFPQRCGICSLVNCLICWDATSLRNR